MIKDLLLFLVILSKVLILLYTPSINSDVWYYADLAQKMIYNQLPYFDFKFEYPPLAILPIWIPALIQQSITHFSKENYIENFRFLNFVVDLMFIFFLKVQFERNNNYKSYLIFNLLISIIMAPLLYDRLDLIFAFLIFLIFNSLQKEEKNDGLFYTMVGIPFKLISILFVPFFGISYFKEKDFDLRYFIQKIVFPGCLFLFILVVLFQFKFMDFLSYHQQRGIQIESTWSTVYFLIQKYAQQPMLIEYNYGAQHLKDVPFWLSTMANYAFMVMLMFLMIMYYLKNIPLRSVLFTTLLIFLCFSKVFSPQFLLWLIPLYIFEENSRQDQIIFGVMCFLTILIFIDYGDLMHQKQWAWWCLVVRNALLLYLTCKRLFQLQRFSRWNEFGLFERFSQSRSREVLQD